MYQFIISKPGEQVVSSGVLQIILNINAQHKIISESQKAVASKIAEQL